MINPGGKPLKPAHLTPKDTKKKLRITKHVDSSHQQKSQNVFSVPRNSRLFNPALKFNTKLDPRKAPGQQKMSRIGNHVYCGRFYKGVSAGQIEVPKRYHKTKSVRGSYHATKASAPRQNFYSSAVKVAGKDRVYPKTAKKYMKGASKPNSVRTVEDGGQVVVVAGPKKLEIVPKSKVSRFSVSELVESSVSNRDGSRGKRGVQGARGHPAQFHSCEKKQHISILGLNRKHQKPTFKIADERSGNPRKSEARFSVQPGYKFNTLKQATSAVIARSTQNDSLIRRSGCFDADSQNCLKTANLQAGELNASLPSSKIKFLRSEDLRKSQPEIDARGVRLSKRRRNNLNINTNMLRKAIGAPLKSLTDASGFRKQHSGQLHQSSLQEVSSLVGSQQSTQKRSIKPRRGEMLRVVTGRVPSVENPSHHSRYTKTNNKGGRQHNDNSRSNNHNRRNERSQGYQWAGSTGGTSATSYSRGRGAAKNSSCVFGLDRDEASSAEAASSLTLANKLKAKTSQNLELKKKIRKMVADMEDLTASLEASRSREDGLEARGQALEREKAGLEGRVEELELELEGSQRELRMSQDRNRELLSGNKALQHEKSALIEAQKTMLKKVGKLVGQEDQLRKQLVERSGELQRSKAELGALRNEKEVLSSQTAKIKNSAKHYKERLKEVKKVHKNELMNFKEEIDKLKDVVKEYDSKLENLSAYEEQFRMLSKEIVKMQDFQSQNQTCLLDLLQGYEAGELAFEEEERRLLRGDDDDQQRGEQEAIGGGEELGDGERDDQGARRGGEGGGGEGHPRRQQLPRGQLEDGDGGSEFDMNLEDRAEQGKLAQPADGEFSKLEHSLHHSYKNANNFENGEDFENEESIFCQKQPVGVNLKVEEKGSKILQNRPSDNTLKDSQQERLGGLRGESSYGILDRIKRMRVMSQQIQKLNKTEDRISQKIKQFMEKRRSSLESRKKLIEDLKKLQKGEKCLESSILLEKDNGLHDEVAEARRGDAKHWKRAVTKASIVYTSLEALSPQVKVGEFLRVSKESHVVFDAGCRPLEPSEGTGGLLEGEDLLEESEVIQLDGRDLEACGGVQGDLEDNLETLEVCEGQRQASMRLNWEGNPEAQKMINNFKIGIKKQNGGKKTRRVDSKSSLPILKSTKNEINSETLNCLQKSQNLDFNRKNLLRSMTKDHCEDTDRKASPRPPRNGKSPSKKKSSRKLNFQQNNAVTMSQPQLESVRYLQEHKEAEAAPSEQLFERKTLQAMKNSENISSHNQQTGTSSTRPGSVLAELEGAQSAPSLLLMELAHQKQKFENQQLLSLSQDKLIKELKDEIQQLQMDMLRLKLRVSKNSKFSKKSKKLIFLFFFNFFVERREREVDQPVE